MAAFLRLSPASSGDIQPVKIEWRIELPKKIGVAFLPLVSLRGGSPEIALAREICRRA
jgi:hypothetical protein